LQRFVTDTAQAPAETGAPSRRTALIVVIPVAFSLAAYAGAICRLPITGDEPHYLIMAESVATDFDLDLRNNHEDEARRPRFYGAVAPHVGKVARGWMPFHAPGLSVLLAIPAGLAGVPGARFALIVLSSVIPWALFRWLASVMPEMTAAWLTLGVAISLPFCFGSQEIYPDLPAGACALALALWLLRRPREHASIAAWAGWSLFCGLLPWLNAKFMASTAVLAIAGAAVTYPTAMARAAHRPALAARHVLPAPFGPAPMVAFT